MKETTTIRRLPARAGKPIKKDFPSLEETLRYFATLIRGDSKNNEERARELGIDNRTLARREFTPDWTLARKVAEEVIPRRENSFGAYVFKQLSPEAQKTWNDLQYWAEHRDAAAKIQAILSYKNKKIRQEIFIHALVSTTFDLSKACRLAGVDKDLLDHWRMRDLEFAQLVEEVQFHKKNFFEKAMLDLVSQRHPLATIWVNKTVNADRGYSEKLRVEHTVDANGVNFDELDLDIETRRKILEAIRKKRESSKALPAPIDVPAIAEHSQVAA